MRSVWGRSKCKKPFLSQKIHNINKNAYTKRRFYATVLLLLVAAGHVFNHASRSKRLLFLQVSMFSLFKGVESPEALKKKAKQTFDKVTALTADTFEANSLRRGLALLSCAHLDKTFIAGAERTADWQQMAAFAVAKDAEAPPFPKADCYQKVRSGKSDIWVYLPTEYAERAFLFGAKYQRTELNSEQAIASMQQLADTICRSEIGLSYEIDVLKFLRHELSAVERNADVQEDLSGMPSE